MSLTSVGRPQKFAPGGPSSRTPQRNRLPSSLSANSTVAAKHGQPSSAVTGVMAVSLQAADNLPWASQLPASRALRKILRVSPERYLNCTATLAIGRPGLLGSAPSRPSPSFGSPTEHGHNVFSLLRWMIHFPTPRHTRRQDP